MWANFLIGQVGGHIYIYNFTLYCYSVCVFVCLFAFVGWFVCLLLLVGLLVCWFVGLLVCWFVGLLVCWFVGLLVCWFVGLLVCLVKLLSK